MPKHDKLTVGLVLDTSLDQPDGVQQYVISLGEWLRGQGHEVHYLVGETKRTDLKNIHSLSHNISVQSNGNRTTIPLPTSRKKLKAVLRQYNFDVLHVQVPHSPFMAQRLIKAADAHTAVVGTYHIVSYSWLETVGTKLLGIWLRPSLKRFDKMLSVSSAAQSFAEQTFGIVTEVLPNVFDYQRFHQAKPMNNIDNGELTILFLGRLVQRKGCMVLLEAINQLDRSDLPEFRVVICGKGHLEQKLRDYVLEHQLENIVHFTGFVDESDKPAYYSAADISVFPSSGGESFGIVLLEAMASGNSAVLAGDNPGYRTVMSPKPELLFDPTDPTELASKLAYYLENAAARQQISSWGADYTKDFDVSVVGKKLVKIYRDALRNRPKQ